MDSLNPRVLDAKYAVRGDIVLRAMKIQEELEKGTGNYPFKKLIYCNIGNPQALGQPPMTFIRQVPQLPHASCSATAPHRVRRGCCCTIIIA